MAALKPKAVIKSKKKANKKKEEERRRLEEEEAEEENELEFQKACLEIRVKELETLNLGLRQKCNYFESQNDVYKVQLEETKDEKNDMVAHLTRKLSEQVTISKELEERLVGMQKARADDWKAFHERIAEKDSEFQDMKEKLEENIQALELRLASIDDFQQNKTNTEWKMKTLEETIETERKHFNFKYEELERKMILYRDQVKNDAVETLVNLAKDVQRIGKLSLTSTIKSTIATNIKLNDELEKVSESNLELRSQLDTLTRSAAERRKFIQILEKDKNISQRKCTQYRKVVELCLEKQVELSDEIKSVESVRQDLGKLQALHSQCKSTEQIQEIVSQQLEIFKKDQAEENRSQIAAATANLMEELKQLQILIINTAIITKDMLQAQSGEELEFLKSKFKSMIITIYETACDFDNLSDEIRARLSIPVPQITEYMKIGFGK